MMEKEEEAQAMKHKIVCPQYRRQTIYYLLFLFLLNDYQVAIPYTAAGRINPLRHIE